MLKPTRPNPSGSIHPKTSRATAAAVTSESTVGLQVEVGTEVELEVGSEVEVGSEPELEVGSVVRFGSEVDAGAEVVLTLSGPSTVTPAPLPTSELLPHVLSVVLSSEGRDKGKGGWGIRPSA